MPIERARVRRRQSGFSAAAARSGRTHVRSVRALRPSGRRCAPLPRRAAAPAMSIPFAAQTGYAGRVPRRAGHPSRARVAQFVRDQTGSMEQKAEATFVGPRNALDQAPGRGAASHQSGRQERGQRQAPDWKEAKSATVRAAQVAAFAKENEDCKVQPDASARPDARRTMSPAARTCGRVRARNIEKRLEGPRV